MNNQLFLYCFEFIAWENPRERKEAFEESLKAYVESNGMECGMSALGGMTDTRGFVANVNSTDFKTERDRFVDWAKHQPVKCTAKLSAIENDQPDLEFFRELDDCIFVIDNLSEPDRVQAAQQKQALDAKIQSAIANRQNKSDRD